jgi:ketosteroid isomerase-like protein
MQTDTTPTTETNEGLIMAGYDAFSRGDMTTVFKVLAEDISWHVPGRGPLAGDYHGHAEVLGFIQHFMELSDGTFAVDVDDVMASGDRVVVLVTSTARAGGLTWMSPQVHVWTFRNGRATVFREFQGDQQTEDEFWENAEKLQAH